MKKSIYLFLIGFVFFACSKKDVPDPFLEYNRTVLVYMIAENSLSGDSNSDLNEMTAAMKNIEGNLIVYIDNSSAPPQLLAFNKGEQVVIKQYNEQNSASAAVLSSVIAEVKSRYPSDHYGLVLWSHGNGWIPASAIRSAAPLPKTFLLQEEEIDYIRRPNIYIDPIPSVKAFGQDGTNWMDNSDLKTAIADNAFEFIVFDACLMSGIEVLNELKNKATYLIVSPAEILSYGFYYTTAVPQMLKGNINGICDAYFNYYNNLSGIMKSATIAAVKTSEIDGTLSLMKSILAANISKINNESMTGIQRYSITYPTAFFDLDDFIQRIATNSEYSLFSAQLNRMVTYKLATPSFYKGGANSFDINHFSGVNCYVPFASFGYDALYMTTDFYKAIYP